MSAASVITQVVWEDSAVACMARITGIDGDAVQQADVSSVACKSFDSDDDSLVSSPSVVVADSIYNTLQTGSGWTVDSTGFNFRFVVPGTAFPTGGKVYVVEFVLTMAAGQTVPVVYELTAKNLRSS